MISRNSAVLAVARPGSVARLRTNGVEFEAAAPTYAYMPARGLAALAQVHGKQVLASAVECGKTVAFRPVNGDLLAQALVEEQRWSVLSGTSPIAPTARMTATLRGVLGPYPWRQPV